MVEAYLVVLTQLAREAEEGRERLEHTAITDIDYGLANARAALLAETGGGGFARIQPGPAGGNPAGHAGTARGGRTRGRDGDLTG